MNVPLAKFPISGRGIAVAVLALAILTSIAPHEASAKGGTFHLFSSTAQAATLTSNSSRMHETSETLGGCGGKRYRDPITHRCHGPADFGH